MFTGIIEEIGLIQNITEQNGGYRLALQAKLVLENTKLGDSIAVSGICLTVVKLGNNFFEVDVMPETWRRSCLSNMKSKAKVNLERALLPTTRLGGHLVSGHIDGKARLINRDKQGNSLWYEFEPEPHLLKHIAYKGSIALDGTSLTIAEVTRTTFTVGLIPTTQELTTLSFLRVGDQVNVETDMIAKYLERLLEYQNPQARPTIDLEFLKRNGYA